MLDYLLPNVENTSNAYSFAGTALATVLRAFLNSCKVVPPGFA